MIQHTNLASNCLVLDNSIGSIVNPSVPVTIQSHLSTSTAYLLTLPSSLPSIQGSLLSSDVNGQLDWIQPIPQNKILDANSTSSVTCNGSHVIIQADNTTVQSSSGSSLVSFIQNGAIDVHQNRLINLPVPSYANDAVNRAYCDANAQDRLRVQINELPQISVSTRSANISNVLVSRERVETYDTHVTYLYQLQIELIDDAEPNTFSFVLPNTQSGTGVANRALVIDRYQFIDSDGYARELAGSSFVYDNTVRCRFLGAGINLSHVVTLCIDVQTDYVKDQVAFNAQYTFVAPNDLGQINLSAIPAGQSYNYFIDYDTKEVRTAPPSTVPR